MTRKADQSDRPHPGLTQASHERFAAKLRRYVEGSVVVARRADALEAEPVAAYLQDHGGAPYWLRSADESAERFRARVLDELGTLMRLAGLPGFCVLVELPASALVDD